MFIFSDIVTVFVVGLSYYGYLLLVVALPVVVVIYLFSATYILFSSYWKF